MNRYLINPCSSAEAFFTGQSPSKWIQDNIQSKNAKLKLFYKYIYRKIEIRPKPQILFEIILLHKYKFW